MVNFGFWNCTFYHILPFVYEEIQSSLQLKLILSLTKINYLTDFKLPRFLILLITHYPLPIINEKGNSDRNA